MPATSRRELRERVQAEAAAASRVATNDSASSSVRIVPGEGQLYTSRHDMRVAATEIAHEITVTTPSVTIDTAPTVTVPAASFGAAEEEQARLPQVRRDLSPRPLIARQASASVAHGLTGHRVPTPKSRARRVTQRLTAGVAFTFIGSLVVATTLPAQALPSAAEMQQTLQIQPADAAQSVMIEGSAEGSLDARDVLRVNDVYAGALLSPDELAQLQAVSDAEPIGSSYGGAPAQPGVWSKLETDYTQSPFPTNNDVPVSSSFQSRWGTFHGGVDLTPGAGTPIYPIANGVVSEVYQGNNPGGGGYTVFIDHNINGQFVQSWYAHMQAGSIDVEVGQVVTLNTQIGQVGATGRVTGPHLHLELKNDEYRSFDPMLWLQSREFFFEPF